MWINVIGIGVLQEDDYNIAINGLTPDTQYFYSINAINSGGEAWGASRTFLTLANNFSSWSSSNGVTGLASDDDDNDGFSNLLEYALGLNQGSPDLNVGSFNQNVISFPKGTEAVANGDILFTIETSPNMQDPWTTVTPTVDNNSTISYTLPNGQVRLFARLRVTQNN